MADYSMIPFGAVEDNQRRTPFDLLGSIGKLEALRGLRDENQIRQMQIQSAQQAQTDDQNARKLPDNAPVGDIIRAVGPDRAFKIVQERHAAAKADAESKLQQINVANAQVEQARRELEGVHDQQGYDLAKQSLLDKKIADPQFIQSLPAQFTPELKQSLAMRAVSTNESLNQARAQVEQGWKEKDHEFQVSLQPFQKMKAIAEADTAQQKAEGSVPMTEFQQKTLARQATANTPTELAMVANDPNRPQAERDQARAAMKDLEKHAIASRPVTNVSMGGGNPNDPKDIAAAIVDGKQPPDLSRLYKAAAPVRAELARQGFDLTTASRDWEAIKKHISTLNGAQQERLRQAITFTYDSLDNIESLYKEWKSVAPTSGFKDLNRATLAAMKRLPGQAGAVATNLEAQINDLTSELGTVYKGGNGSTDESLRLAAGNLKADWNDATFNRGLQQIRKNLQIRRNSIMNSQPAGVSEGSQYAAPHAGAPAATKAPKVGDVEDGHVFLGGNPADQKSWKLVGGK